jgi:methylenetetrahydrofolate dehydrogenase (NADP+) / methenyltetrahydrofolate cyclohydrolase
MPISLRADAVIAKEMPLLQERMADLRSKGGAAPRFVVVLVGSHPASEIYVAKKIKTASDLGFIADLVRFDEAATPEEVKASVAVLNQDKTVHGILIQRPLPKGFQEQEVLMWVAPHKDVDGLHPENQGLLATHEPRFVSCTPMGVMKLLTHYKIPVAGKVAGVVGRSFIVGRPMAQLLLRADATVINLHSRTVNPKALSIQCDILIVAAGKMGLVDASWVKPGATVIDVGIHRNSEGKIVGDVDAASVSSVAGALSPVPGGVGPLTILSLMENCVRGAQIASSLR